MRKGNIARQVYFVVKGCLRIYLIGEDGNEWTRFLIFEGRMGMAFPSFILRQPSVAAIQSLEPAELLTLSYTDRELLFREIPGFERLMGFSDDPSVDRHAVHATVDSLAVIFFKKSLR